MLLPAFTTLGAGPVILMLHGIGGGHRAFAPQVETFASLGYRAVAWDMPGYGHSAPIEPYTFKGLAQSCITLIESLLHDKRAAASYPFGPQHGRHGGAGGGGAPARAGEPADPVRHLALVRQAGGRLAA